tara:strand:+ start:144 stop:794 length:651 start_codon:yes stop_codon:yes gene_type:complete
LPKKLSELQKQEISKSFLEGSEIKKISEIYSFSSQTIIKQLKKILGEQTYQEYKLINSKKRSNIKEQFKYKKVSKKENIEKENVENQKYSKDNNQDTFIELIPLNEHIELEKRKELSSIPITEFDLPEIVYMLVDKKIELDPKILKDYTEWTFMPEKDLSRLTLEIFSNQKKAKICCSKNQKIIKIPNSKVISTVSRFLKAKGITRIIYEDSLLSL